VKENKLKNINVALVIGHDLAWQKKSRQITSLLSDVICPRLDNSQTHIKQTVAEFA
jgi:hypothetical protein